MHFLAGFGVGMGIVLTIALIIAVFDYLISWAGSYVEPPLWFQVVFFGGLFCAGLGGITWIGCLVLGYAP